jgi:hypothetical protein
MINEKLRRLKFDFKGRSKSGEFGVFETFYKTTDDYFSKMKQLIRENFMKIFGILNVLLSRNEVKLPPTTRNT